MKKKFVPAVLAAMITIPTATFASEKGVTKEGQIPNKIEHFLEVTPILKAHEKFGQHFIKHLDITPKQEKQYLSLVEKYTPQSLTEWQQTIDERQALMQQWRDLNPKEMLKEKRQEIIRERQAKMDELLDQLIAGKITKEQFKQTIQQWKEERKEQLMHWKDEKVSALQTVMEQEKAVHRQLQKALASKDSEAISKALSQFLSHLQAENEKFAQLIENVKQNQTTNSTK